ncbi:hypothetical protein J6590_070819, partial [Homalodisca vitripennis]
MVDVTAPQSFHDKSCISRPISDSLPSRNRFPISVLSQSTTRHTRQLAPPRPSSKQSLPVLFSCVFRYVAIKNLLPNIY